MASFIMDILEKHYSKGDARVLFNNSTLLQYLEKKTKSVDRGSKARGSFANIYAIYVLVEDYINKGYLRTHNYSSYDGMTFTDALNRTRELPFGEKLQNHALNDRCNDEFRKFFNAITSEVPIIRNLDTRRYWINEKLLIVPFKRDNINIAKLCIEIVDRYVELKQENFSSLFSELKALQGKVSKDPNSAVKYIGGCLKPNTDARLFEIVSYVIIKYYYLQRKMSYSIDGHNYPDMNLTVYKVGRTNANDGGIDYIMLPLGRIFQVTEVLDFKKYFLDIHKLLHYPITFVVKQDMSPKEAMTKIVSDAKAMYTGGDLTHYLECFQEIITIPTLINMLNDDISKGFLKEMIDELILQCQVEYNIKD